MAERLKSRRAAHTILAALQMGSLLSIIVSAIFMLFGYNIAAGLFFILGAIAAAVGLCTALYILILLSGPSSRRTAVATAVLFLLASVALLFSGPLWELCHGAMISVCCGLLAALLAAELLSFIKDESMTVIVVATGLVFALAVFFGFIGYAVYAIIALAAASAVAAIITIKKARMYSLCGIVLSVLTIVTCLSSKNDSLQSSVHPLLPFAAAVGCAALITGAVAALSWPAAESRRSARTKSPSVKVSKPSHVSEVPAKQALPAKPTSPAANAAKWVNKAYSGKSYAEIAAAPVDALYGISADDAKLLKESFGIVTVRDFAENKFFGWADEIVKEAEAQRQQD